MIVFHGTFLENKFFLWGEIPDQPKNSAFKKAKKRHSGSKNKSHLQSGPSHPKPLCYDAGVEKLSSVLKEIGFNFKVIKKFIQSMTVWLPTVDDQPVPSSPLIGEPPESAKKANLVPWKMTGLQLPLEKAVEFLCRSIGKQILGPGIIVGRDLTFWAAALRFAGALVTKGQFLPDISEIHGVSIAHWRPIFSGFDSGRLSKLGNSMPAVAAAQSFRNARGGSIRQEPHSRGRLCHTN